MALFAILLFCRWNSVSLRGLAITSSEVVQRESFGPRKGYDLEFLEIKTLDSGRIVTASLQRLVGMYIVPFNQKASKCTLEGLAYCATSFMALQTVGPLFT